MRYVLDDVKVGELSGEIQRRGLAARQRVRVVVETLDADLPMAALAEHGGAFDFLADEPDIYSEADLKRDDV